MTETEGSTEPDGVEALHSEGQALDLLEQSARFIEGLLDAMDVDGEVEVETTREGDLRVSIEGSEGGLLIGRRGRTLDALQDLLRAAMHRSLGRGPRINLDVEGYRGRRRETLEKQTAETIQRVHSEGEIEMEAMSAYERKLVHDLVAGSPGVTSFSEGEDPQRRVVIKPEDV